jgi:superfamily II DNA or RNA helicase
LPHYLTTGGQEDPLLPKLKAAIHQADEIELAVAFIRSSGLELLFNALTSALTDRQAKLRILTSDYLDVTEPKALRQLMLLAERGADVRIFEVGTGTFHLKTYICVQAREGSEVGGTAWVGSSNLTHTALTHGLEWNYRIDQPEDTDQEDTRRFREIREKFVKLFEDPRVAFLDHDWIDAYQERRKVIPLRVAGEPLEEEQDSPPPRPRELQEEALTALAQSRGAGYERGLVVLATGLGKTYLAAFDAHQMKAARILFVAHREEILLQAEATFQKIFPQARVGYYTGNRQDACADLLFASVQTLGQKAHYEEFEPNHFDYIVVDEFHHAAAATYRGLIRHFTPRFLLGLTATPERTDQADILTLCDDNLVFRADIFRGIEEDLLAPFTYYGIHDQTVRYEEIPWRNGRFDPHALDHQFATQKRARHALKEWRDKAGSRTLAFCVSRKHADFMAAHFREAGIRSAPVYRGSSMDRSQALEELRAGALDVIFAVDLFNEGVDAPAVDTVMMLRPTESKVLFLQQLGRGLRPDPHKERLRVLDFIGNHRGFLHKPQALLSIGSTYPQLARFARQVENDRLELPSGCFVNYDLAVIDFLKGLDRNGVDAEYEAIRASQGRRPTRTEMYRAGVTRDRIRRRHGHWWELVRAQGDLTSGEEACLERHKAFLAEMEKTSMTKSFKMVLLEALLAHNGFVEPPSIADLSAWSLEIFRHRRPLIPDIHRDYQDIDNLDLERWRRYWESNPINALTGGNQAQDGQAWFRVREGRFEPSFEVRQEETDTFQGMLQEVVDYRLAEYQDRQELKEEVEEERAPVRELPQGYEPTEEIGTDLAFFPDLPIACGHFRTGRAETEDHVRLKPGHGRLDPERHFVARAVGDSMDGGRSPIRDGDFLLLEWFGSERAGSITGSTMVVERQDSAGDDQYLLRVVRKTRDGGYILEANNPDYPDLEADQGMRTLARLREVLSPEDFEEGYAPRD